MKTDLKPFAAFDIDGTLIRWQLFHAIVDQLGQKGYISSADYKTIQEARDSWSNRNHAESFREYESTLLKIYADVITSISPLDQDKITDSVSTEYQDRTHIYTRQLISTLKQRGYLLFAVSGSHDDAVSKVAKRHNFDDWIGSKFEIEAGSFTGNHTSPVHNKAAALRRLVKKHNATYKGSYAVGDSLSDASMLEIVENPIVFNPDKPLFEKAKQSNWPVVIERKNIVYELEPSSSGYQLKLAD